jgi:alkanesulfonate monooxygenase SsuD/methylene tetrahydromethanopterin reductase-like flavin-dependent oxidoreductase (luciferase family)
MPKFNLGFDMRSPEFGAPTSTLYAEAMEMVSYADARGIDYVAIMEHHGSADGYIPTPFVLGAAFAARTTKMRIQLGAVILPLHDPVEVAEQIAVLDLISNGRLTVILGAGYVPAEFRMFNKSIRERGKALDKGIPIIQRALCGERFIEDGREIYVRPLPVQRPYPPLYLGGGVAATAKRAARLNTGLFPMNPSIVPLYREECANLGRAAGEVILNLSWFQVSDDPERAWHELGPHLLHIARSYAEWAGPASSSPFIGIDSIEKLKNSGLFTVVMPEEFPAFAAEADKIGTDLALMPLMGGLDPKIGWRYLEYFVDKILPNFRSGPRSIRSLDADTT